MDKEKLEKIELEYQTMELDKLFGDYEEVSAYFGVFISDLGESARSVGNDARRDG